MNIFDQFVIPPSQEHVGLLTVMQIISLLTFLPFAGIMLGASSFSLFFNSKGKRSGNPLYTQIAKDIIDKLIVGKAAGFALSVLPMISIVLVYAQMLNGAKVITVSMLFLSLILFIVGYVFIYNYKSAFQFEHILNAAKKDEVSDEVKSYENKIVYMGARYGTWGIFVLLVSMFLFTSGVTLASKPGIWNSVDNILKLIITPSIWVNFAYFLSSSAAITGGAILYFFFVWQGGVRPGYTEYNEAIKKFSIITALVGVLVQPLFIFANVLFLKAANASSGVYVFAGLSLLAVLIISNLLYHIYKNSEINFSGIVFFLIFVLFAFTIIKDQLMFRNAAREHLIVLNMKAEELAQEKSGSIVQVSAADGEKIYSEKCIACHRFDQKVVGPPYQETVPKYSGDLKKLAGFIYNPQKVNPDYPAMPNQGLKQKEAEAVAKYIMDKVGKK
ncbi:MAG: c-type cytochrome [Ignavibacteria bacterium]|nr:c-type cytochrome [Ignavibacteria bacterium]